MLLPFVVLSALTSLSCVLGHYCWPSVDDAPEWDVVRRTDNYQTRLPIQDVTSPNFTCYNGAGGTAARTYSVTAGNLITFKTDNNLYHIGVVNVYMAKAPGKAADFDGKGNVWFKVYQISVDADPTGQAYPTFPANFLPSINFTIPRNVPTGEYLLRVEHIALHDAYYFGGAQFYVGCAQLAVTGGGSGKPGPLVAIPGVYTGREPGIIFDAYVWPPVTNYTQPGPAVWTG